jgi:hypothetical protein
MVATTKEAEREYLLKLAKDYRGKDYQIVFQPSLDILPDFLREYKPDMLALGSHESVVVEVKSRPLLKGDSDYLKSLAQTVESHPGWRFELVVLALEDDQDGSDLDHPSQLQETLQIQDIEAGLQSARKLILSQPESALLYVWSLIEAILRLLSKSEGISLKSFDAVYLIKTLVSEGVISRSDCQLLMNILPLRNAIAHGFKVDELDVKTIGELIDLSTQLLLLVNAGE